MQISAPPKVKVYSVYSSIESGVGVFEDKPIPNEGRGGGGGAVGKCW